MRRFIWLCMLVPALLEACNIGVGEGPDTYYPPQTRIVRIDLTPDTVATKDTVLIHCVIEDSTDTRFKYYWRLGKGTLPVNGTLNGPYIKWIATDFNIPTGSTFVTSAGVAVDDGSSDSLGVTKSFDIPVIKK